MIRQIVEAKIRIAGKNGKKMDIDPNVGI